MRETVSYERICGTVASLLLLFHRIESEAHEIIAKAPSATALPKVHGARGILMSWKNLLLADQTRPDEALLAERIWAQIQRPLDVRNGICHGLIGASAERDDSPATLTWRFKGGTRSMNYDELQKMFAWLSKIPQAMGMISHGLCDQGEARGRKLPERDFWISEFGIEFYDASTRRGAL